MCKGEGLKGGRVQKLIVLPKSGAGAQKGAPHIREEGHKHTHEKGEGMYTTRGGGQEGCVFVCVCVLWTKRCGGVKPGGAHESRGGARCMCEKGAWAKGGGAKGGFIWRPIHRPCKGSTMVSLMTFGGALLDPSVAAPPLPPSTALSSPAPPPQTVTTDPLT